MTPCSFLPSLSQYSEENMMDPYNLAICFGPTLMSVPEGHDQVSCQAHVNELIKTIIIHHDTIFPGPQDLQGPIYTIPGAGEDFWYVGKAHNSRNDLVPLYVTRRGWMMKRLETRSGSRRYGGVMMGLTYLLRAGTRSHEDQITLCYTGH